MQTGNMIVKIEPYVIRQVLIASCLNIGQILNGYSIYWTAPIIPKLLNIEETPLARVITETEASWVATVLMIGGIGSFLAGYGSNVIGRRPCLILCGVFLMITYLILAFATSVATIYVGRLFVGIGVGMLSLITMMYLGEITSSNIRGTLMSATSVFHSLGGLLVYCVGPYVSYAVVNYILIGISIVFIATSYFLPESPLYNVLKGNEEAAKESLRKLGRSKDIETELKRMMEQTLEMKSNTYLWQELFTEKENRRGLYVTIPSYIFQQSSGNLAVIFFATTIFQAAGSSIAPHIATMIIGATSLLSSTLAPMFIDKYGRRVLLTISTTGCCVSMTVLGVYFYLDHIGDSSVQWLGWLPLLCLVSSILFYGAGLNIIPNTLTGEMFTPAVRGIGSSITLCIGFISGLIANNVFSYVVVAVGNYASFWIFAAVNAIALCFVVAFVPETKGKTLTEIGNMMGE